jgi:membrane protease YdiL (CAAX protease family)
MTDPTVLAIRISLIVTLAAFIVAAVARRFLAGPAGPPAEQTALPSEAAAVYEPPQQTPGPPPLPAGRIPVWPYRHADLLWMGFLFLVFGLLSLAGAAASPAEEPRLPGLPDLVLSIGMQLFLAGTTLAFIAGRIGPTAWLGLRWNQWPWVFLIAPATVIGMWLVFGALAAAGYMDWVKELGADPLQESVRLLQTTRDPLVIAMMVLAAVIVAPVCEEIVFRGYLYPAAKKFAGTWVAGGCTALLFAAAHGNFAALLPLFLFGIVLVVLYEKTGSIWAPIAVHLCFNGATVAVQLLAPYLVAAQEQS